MNWPESHLRTPPKKEKKRGKEKEKKKKVKGQPRCLRTADA
jgi:hypothetical protein